MKILQIGKFYPIIGGVEKVMFNLTGYKRISDNISRTLVACLEILSYDIEGKHVSIVIFMQITYFITN